MKPPNHPPLPMGMKWLELWRSWFVIMSTQTHPSMQLNVIFMNVCTYEPPYPHHLLTGVRLLELCKKN